jgi:integrase
LARSSSPSNGWIEAWDVNHAQQFLRETADGADSALWQLLLATGCRIGEALALSWADVDWSKRTLSIRRTVIQTKGGVAIGRTTKTKRGRSLAVSGRLLDLLRVHRAHQNAARLAAGPLWQDHDLIFPSATSGPRSPDALRDRFRTLCRQRRLPKRRFRGLRHTAATLMLANGEHPKVVEERLGHSSIAITMNVYAHVTMTMQREAAERLDALLTG